MYFQYFMESHTLQNCSLVQASQAGISHNARSNRAVAAYGETYVIAKILCSLYVLVRRSA